VYERAAAYVPAGNLDRYLYNEFHMKSDLSENNNGLQSPCRVDYRLKLRCERGTAALFRRQNWHDTASRPIPSRGGRRDRKEKRKKEGKKRKGEKRNLSFSLSLPLSLSLSLSFSLSHVVREILDVHIFVPLGINGYNQSSIRDNTAKRRRKEQKEMFDSPYARHRTQNRMILLSDIAR